MSRRRELGDRAQDPGAVPGTTSVQFVVNPKAGDNNDQVHTEVEVGLRQAASRLVVYTDTGTTGSIGNHPRARAALISTAPGTFKVLNDSRFTGDVIIAAGTLSLESSLGGSLSRASSVNFASTFTQSR